MAKLNLRLLGKTTANGDKLLSMYERLLEKEAVAGIFAGKQYDNEKDVVEVAMRNEFGDSTTPSRPFMKQAFDGNQTKLNKMIADGIQNNADADELISNVASEMEADIKNSINSGQFVPNSPSTVKKKGSNKPLVDTGLMLNSVEHKVINKAEGDS